MAQLNALLLLFLMFALQVSGQTIPGKLLLVGGGTENAGKWSDAPYSWAIEQSANKRVAIITYETNPSQWLPDYFEDLGAAEAKNFLIPSSTVANQQETYDSLVTYDVIFFKGGNQKTYYNTFKNTLTHQAVEDVFSNGGVIGGTSAGEMLLSKVLFTAQNGTVYPDEAIFDPNNQYMTLADDFLDLMPGYIFDSHFVERARFARLIGFLGNWKLNNNEDITGIGVDDKTAFCIDENLMGYAFGTGSVNIYKAASDNQFSLGGTKLLATNLEVIQLLNECTINLNTFEITGYNDFIPTKFEGEQFNGYVLLSGSDNVNKNLQFISHFAAAVTNDSVLIVTGNNTSAAQQIKSKLAENDAYAEIMQAIPSNYNSDFFLGKVDRIPKILFINNDYSVLMDFIQNGAVGNLLHERLLDGVKITGFIGGDSRYAGGLTLVNYDQQYASYDGLLEFDQGLGLLKSVIVVPKAFENEDIEENAAAGVPFGMLLDSLKYGIWLHDDTYAEYKVNDENQTTITSYGSYPAMFAWTDGTYGGFSDQSAVNSGRPRHVAGFEKFNMTLMDESMVKQLGYTTGIQESFAKEIFSVYPNPSDGFISISAKSDQFFLITVRAADGRIIAQRQIKNNQRLDLSCLPDGFYMVTAEVPESGKQYHQKLIIGK